MRKWGRWLEESQNGRGDLRNREVGEMVGAIMEKKSCLMDEEMEKVV